MLVLTRKSQEKIQIGENITITILRVKGLAVRVGIDGRLYDGVASFGRRPTFDNGAPLLEIFLFDFKGDLYGKTLDVAFIAYIRDELKFDSIKTLVRQMDDDSAKARAALAAAPNAFPKLGQID